MRPQTYTSYGWRCGGRDGAASPRKRAMNVAEPQRDRLATEESARGFRPGQDHCIFECGPQVFAIELAAVREVLSGKLATPVPQAPPALVGVVDLHSDVLTVVQLCI